MGLVATHLIKKAQISMKIFCLLFLSMISIFLQEIGLKSGIE